MAISPDGAAIGWGGLGAAALVLPFALLLLGSAIGFPYALDGRTAFERLVGLLLALGVGLLVLLAMHRLSIQGRANACLAAGTVALIGGLWVIAAAGPDIFRGPVGSLLERVCAPLFGRAVLTDPVAVTNTRFIVNYNGLADLCVLTTFASAAVLLGRTGIRNSVMAGLLLAVALAFLIGTGSRGALAGLLVGGCVTAVCLFRWGWIFGAVGAVVLVTLAATGLLDKGLELSSTAGRVQFWQDIARLGLEYPLTGVGLGVDTVEKVLDFYEINPDPARLAYAHDTFVQSFLEQGPLGALGMVLLPALTILGATAARRTRKSMAGAALTAAALGLVIAFEVHGLTDQVLTSDVGTILLVIGCATVLATVDAQSGQLVSNVTRWIAVGIAVLVAASAILVLAFPAARARALLNLGALRLDQAVLSDGPTTGSGPGDAEVLLSAARSAAPDDPAVLRDLARISAAHYDMESAVQLAQAASTAPGLDAFDMLQIAHLYRDLGFANEAYTWVTRAYETWGRTPNPTVLQTYARATLPDDFRVRTLSDQGEAALLARDYSEATSVFQQALTFAPNSSYLQARLGDAQRGLARQETSGG